MSLPAPVGGWNARDSLGDMEKTDAVELVNMFPATTNVITRYGSQIWNTVSRCETLMAYNAAATTKLIAIANNQIYNVTTQSSTSNYGVTLSNSRFQYVNVATTGGNYLFMVNGADSPYLFDGTNWTNPAITGATTTNFIGINLHKSRVWFVETGTLKAWYLPTAAIAGAVNTLDLSSFCNRGGYLMAMGTWTIDAGYGVDDLAVFITSQGEVVVYRGTDPSSSTTWALVGVFWIGSPIGRRCFVKYKGDLAIITQDGLFAMSSALQSSRLNPKAAITDKIQYAVSQAISSYSSNFGWQVLPYPKQNMLILNVPVTASTQQYVMNTITGAWCRFTGWDANCFEVYGDDLYYADDTYIYKAWTGAADYATSGVGTDISSVGLQAFNYFGSPGQLKRWTLMKANLFTSGAVPLNLKMNVDFDQTVSGISSASYESSGVTAGAFWDTAAWDSDTWTDGYTIGNNLRWRGATGVGYCAAPRLAFKTGTINCQWNSTDIVMEPGGIL